MSLQFRAGFRWSVFTRLWGRLLSLGWGSTHRCGTGLEVGEPIESAVAGAA